jgi:hypothetical protein
MEHPFFFSFFGITLLGISFLWYQRKRYAQKTEKEPKQVFKILIGNKNDRSFTVGEYIFFALSHFAVKESFFNILFKKPAPCFSFEIINSKERIYFFLHTPKSYASLLVNQIYAQYPDAEIELVKDYAKEVPKSQVLSSFTQDITLDLPEHIMITPHQEFEKSGSDPLSAITASISQLPNKNDQIFLQMVVSPLPSSAQKRIKALAKHQVFYLPFEKYHKWYRKKLRDKYAFFFRIFRPLLSLFFAGTKTVAEEEYQELVEKKISQPLFEVTLRASFLPSSPISVSLASSVLQEVLSALKQFGGPQKNEYIFSGKTLRGVTGFTEFYKRALKNPVIMNVSEVNTLWHLPHQCVDTPNLQRVDSKKLQPPLNTPYSLSGKTKDITAIGKTNFRGISKVFGIKTDDRRKHMYVIGKTGMGKSTLLENMIASDLENGNGIAVIDPHGDLVEAVLNFVPKKRSNQVLVFDPSDKDFPVSFNMMECKSEEQQSFIASSLLGVFKKMFDNSWGPRLEYILRNTILALTEVPGTTLLGIMKMLNDEKYRESVLSKVSNRMVLSFWNDEFKKWPQKQQLEAVAPIQNKVGQFLSSSLVRNVFGQPKSSIDLRFAMDTKKIVLINLSKGKIGEDNSSLLGAMFITKFQIDAMSRANIPHDERKDFYLYVDEFQNFATDSFATILSEARKYKLNLTMANQYIDQMGDSVKSAVFGNVGSIVSYQVGADDADVFARQFSAQVEPDDILNLPKHKAYIRLMIDGISSQVFSADMLPPPQQNHLELAKKETIIKLSRERYAKKREFVEEKIGQWMDAPK